MGEQTTNTDVSEQELLDRASEIADQNPNSDTAEIIKKLRRENAARRVEKNELADKLALMEAEMESLTGKLTETSTKFEELNQTATGAAAELDRIKKAVEEANSTVIDSLPDEVKAIVPSGLEPVELRKWLDAAVPVLTTKVKAPPLNGAAGRATRDDKTPVINDEEAVIAARLGLSVEEYAKYKD